MIRFAEATRARHRGCKVERAEVCHGKASRGKTTANKDSHRQAIRAARQARRVRRRRGYEPLHCSGSQQEDQNEDEDQDDDHNQEPDHERPWPPLTALSDSAEFGLADRIGDGRRVSV